MKKWTIAFAAIPLLGWLVSLLHNWWLGGSFFFYSDIAYLPLIAVTSPLVRILRWLSDLSGEHTHRIIFIYALVASVIYGLFGALIGRAVRSFSSGKEKEARGETKAKC